MSNSELEEQKKLVLPFLQRAQEIQKADPKIAYYVRMYAVDQALQLERRCKEITALLGSTLTALEKARGSLDLDKEQDKYYCEAFALKIFSNAERVDRAGRADAQTPKTYLASSYFLEILNQFGPLDSDLLAKQRFAAWRAAEISKAIREGRPPVPLPSIPTASSASSDPFAPGQPLLYEGGGGQQQGFQGSIAGVRDAGYDGGGGGGDVVFGQGGGVSGDHGPGGETFGDGSLSTDLQQHSQYHHQQEYQQPPPPSQQQQQSMDYSQSVVRHGDSAANGGGGVDVLPVLPGQRYRPGCPVLFCTQPEDGMTAVLERGTIGQVLGGEGNPGEGPRYRVALPHIILEAESRQLSPGVEEGGSLFYRPHPSEEQVTVQVVLVNDGMGWPPTYLVKLPEGGEVSAHPSQLSFVADQHSSLDRLPSLPSVPAPLPPVTQHQFQNPYPSSAHSQHSSFSSAPNQDQSQSGPLPPSFGFPNGLPPMMGGGTGGMGAVGSGGGGMGAGEGGNQYRAGGGYPAIGSSKYTSFSDNPSLPPPPPPAPVPPPSSNQGHRTPAPPQPPLQPPHQPSQPPQPLQPAYSQPAHSQRPVHNAPPVQGSYRQGGGGVASPLPSLGILPPGHKPSVIAISEAQKAARTAISALNFEDATSAVKFLTQAVQLLCDPTVKL